MADSSIQRYNNLYRNNENNVYNNNIKSLINEILSLERMKFNYNHNDTEQFLNTPIKLEPSINLYTFRKVDLRIPHLDQSGYKNLAGTHYRVGDFKLSYKYSASETIWYCKLIFTIKDNNKKMCFLITQILEENNKETMYPMKFVSQDGKTYTYDCKMTLDNVRDNSNYGMITEILIFSLG